MNTENKNSKELAYENVLNSITLSPTFFSNELEKLKIKKKFLKPHEYSDEEKEILNHKIHDIESNLDKYTIILKKLGKDLEDYITQKRDMKSHLFKSDVSAISNVAALLTRRNRLIENYNKERIILAKSLEQSHISLMDSLSKSSHILIDSNFSEVLSQDTIDIEEFMILTDEKATKGTYTSPVVNKDSQEDFIDEYNSILYATKEYLDVQKIIQSVDTFNFSNSDISNLINIKGLAQEIAKHKQIIQRIDIALERFGVGLDDAKENPEKAQFEGRYSQFIKTCKALKKLKEKELKMIKKLDYRLSPIYKSMYIEDLTTYIDSKNSIADRQSQKKQKKIEIRNQEEKIAELRRETDKLATIDSIEAHVHISELNSRINELASELAYMEHTISRLDSEIEDFEKQEMVSSIALTSKKYLILTPSVSRKKGNPFRESLKINDSTAISDSSKSIKKQKTDKPLEKEHE